MQSNEVSVLMDVSKVREAAALRRQFFANFSEDDAKREVERMDEILEYGETTNSQ